MNLLFWPFVAFLLLSVITSVWSKPKYAVYSGSPPKGIEHPMISITFDDGPHQTLTPRLLDIFKARNAKATFFVMGVKSIIHPSILARAVKEGHEIGNHGWDHPVMTKVSLDTLHEQMQDTNKAIHNATGVYPRTMRPPYGNTNHKVNEFMYKSENLTAIIWSLDTMDWKRPKPEEIVNRVLSKAKAGDIVLCHDIHPGTIEAMEKVLDGLNTKGFRMVTVSEMLDNEQYHKHRLR